MKQFRILALLLVLLGVAIISWQERYLSTRWRAPLYVAIYPIADDASPVTQRYVEELDSQRFADIDRFFLREAKRYGVPSEEPIKTRLKRELHDKPPPRAASDGVLTTALWSLKLRYWAWRVSSSREPQDVRIFVLYHDPALTSVVPHSLGLSKGLIGVVYAFASPEMDSTNSVVIAHELAHTVGATDKYSARNDAPRFPDGYGEPRQTPLYPQRSAELMAGRRMLSADRWQQAESLEEVVIGPATALEIRWLRSP